jgi:hypothetical protein
VTVRVHQTRVRSYPRLHCVQRRLSLLTDCGLADRAVQRDGCPTKLAMRLIGRATGPAVRLEPVAWRKVLP